MLIVARKANQALTSGENTRSLDEGTLEAPSVRRETEQRSDR